MGLPAGKNRKSTPGNVHFAQEGPEGGLFQKAKLEFFSRPMRRTQKSWEDNNESEKVTAGQNLLAFAVSQHISDSFGPQTQLQLSRATALPMGKLILTEHLLVVSRQGPGTSGRTEKGLRALPDNLDF